MFAPYHRRGAISQAIGDRPAPEHASGLADRQRHSSPGGRTGMNKVFGLGLNKTGTTTLGDCLAALGYRQCPYIPIYERRWERVEPQVWRRIEEYDSFVDWPYPLMFREIYRRYPDAKYILSLRRSPEKWLKSLKQHALQTRWWDSPLQWDQSDYLAYGQYFPFGNDDKYLDFYRRHTREVREFFQDKPGQLLELCWEHQHGWQELCRFLDKPVPAMQIPHANASASRGITARRVWRNKIFCSVLQPYAAREVLGFQL
jgi:hypothetical protein